MQNEEYNYRVIYLFVNAGFFFVPHKVIRSDNLIKMHVPTLGCLLQSIDGSLKLAHFGLICGYETLRLYHIYLLIQLSIQEGGSDIHLSDLVVKMCRQSKHDPNRLEHCHKGECVVIIDTISLTITLGN